VRRILEQVAENRRLLVVPAEPKGRSNPDICEKGKEIENGESGYFREGLD
jgi:hypothetical protein